MSISVKQSGTWETLAESGEASPVQTKVSGTWRECKEVWTRVSGVWEQVFNFTNEITRDGDGTSKQYTISIPPGVNSVDVDLCGAGEGSTTAIGGDSGPSISATIDTSTINTLYINVTAGGTINIQDASIALELQCQSAADGGAVLKTDTNTVVSNYQTFGGTLGGGSAGGDAPNGGGTGGTSDQDGNTPGGGGGPANTVGSTAGGAARAFLTW